MTPVFADTWYFLGLVNQRDQAHRRCVEFSEKYDRAVITTSWVLMEVGDALCRGNDRDVFLMLLEELSTGADSLIVPPTQDLFEKGISLFRSRQDKEWSLTDCTSFIVMQEHGLTEALTSDHHFEQAGFVAVLANDE